LSNNQLVIELPPPGMLIRELAITAINMIGEFGGVKISQVGNEVIVSHDNLGVALGSFSSEVNLIAGSTQLNGVVRRCFNILC